MRVTIDGAQVEVPAGTTVLDAARAAGATVPTLCFDERLAPFGACRVCLVGVAGPDGRTDVVASCTTPCRDGMVVDTRDPRARRVAGAVVELVLSELPARARAAHRARRGRPRPRHRASRAGAARVHARDARHAPPVPRLPARAVHLVRALRARLRRGPGRVRADGDRPRLRRERHRRASTPGFRDSACVSCGACADTCPTDAITELSLLAIADASEDDAESSS